MKLSAIKKAIDEATINPEASQKDIGTPHATLIYGESKSGKTQLAATLANLDFFERVIFMAPEKGVQDTLLAMHEEGRLTDAALDKIEVINIVDTRREPNGFNTIINFLAYPHKVFKICEAHGVIDCGTCTKEKADVIELSYGKLTKRTALVIDSLSQTGESAMNTQIKNKAIDYKPLLDDYGGQGKMIRDLLSIIQAVEYCHIVAITHVDMFEDESGKKRYYPLCGTSKMSPNIAKYFGTVIVTKTDAIKNKHIAASSTTFSALYQTGTRVNVSLENAPECDLKYIYSGRLIPGERYEVVKKDNKVAAKPTTTAPANKAGSSLLQQKLAAAQAKS